MSSVAESLPNLINIFETRESFEKSFSYLSESLSLENPNAVMISQFLGKFYSLRKVKCGIFKALPDAIYNKWMSQEHGAYLVNSILRNLTLLKEIRTISFSFSPFGTGISDHQTSIAIVLADQLYKSVDVHESFWIYEALETWLDEYDESERNLGFYGIRNILYLLMMLCNSVDQDLKLLEKKTLAISNLLQGFQTIIIQTDNINEFLFVEPAQMIEWLYSGSELMGYSWKLFTINILKCWLYSCYINGNFDSTDLQLSNKVYMITDIIKDSVNEPGKEMILVSAKLIQCIAPEIHTDVMYHLWNYFVDYIVVQSHNLDHQSKYLCITKEWESLNNLIFWIAKYVPIEVNIDIKSYKRIFGLLIKLISKSELANKFQNILAVVNFLIIICATNHGPEVATTAISFPMLIECLYSFSRQSLNGSDLKYFMSCKISVGILISSLLMRLRTNKIPDDKLQKLRTSWPLEHLIAEFSDSSIPSLMIVPLAKIMSSSVVLYSHDIDQKTHLMFVKLRGLLIHLCCSKVSTYDGQVEITIILESMVSILTALKRNSLSGVSRALRDVWNEFSFDFIIDRLLYYNNMDQTIDILYVALYRFMEECLSQDSPWMKKILEFDQRSYSIAYKIVLQLSNPSKKIFVDCAYKLVDMMHQVGLIQKKSVMNLTPKLCSQKNIGLFEQEIYVYSPNNWPHMVLTLSEPNRNE